MRGVEWEAHWETWSARDLCSWMDRSADHAAYDRLCRIMRRAVHPKLVRKAPDTG